MHSWPSLRQQLGQTTDTKYYLLNTSKDQTPSDTNTPATKLSVVELDPGGRAIKVVLVDSVGDFKMRVKDWAAYRSLTLKIINLETDTVKLGFNVRHKRTTNYDTRRCAAHAQTRRQRDSPRYRGLDEYQRLHARSANDTGGTSRRKRKVTIVLGDFWFQGTPVPVSKTAATRPGSNDRRTPRCRRSTRSSIRHAGGRRDLPALEVFPADNPWNLVVEDWPLHPNSKKIIASIGANKPLRYNPDMGFVLVPPDQKKVDVKLGRATPTSRTRGRSRCPTTCRSKAGRPSYYATRSCKT